jgi:hypothetical protein
MTRSELVRVWAIVAVCAALIAVGIVVGDAMTPDYGR